MKKIHVTLSMEMPFTADLITTGELRKLNHKIELEQGCGVTIIFECDMAQLQAAERLSGYVPLFRAADHAKRVESLEKGELGFCENWRFSLRGMATLLGDLNDLADGKIPMILIPMVADIAIVARRYISELKAEIYRD